MPPSSLVTQGPLEEYPRAQLDRTWPVRELRDVGHARITHVRIAVRSASVR